MNKIAFVTPWFADKNIGGAEVALHGIASHLYAKGVDIEILTTCVENSRSDWSYNYYPTGLDTVAGIPVRRFPVRKLKTFLFSEINKKLMSGMPISVAEEDVFLEEMVNSPALYDYMNKNKDDYSLFVFIPYMFGTTYFGCKICPEKSVLIPCFHDESYAYFERFKDAFQKVRGMVFNADAEMRLAEKIYDLDSVNTSVIGVGMDTDISGNPDAFRKKYNIKDPFILYAGRKDEGKNVPLLLQYFAAYKKQIKSNLKLVLIGSGDIGIPECSQADIINLDFIPMQEKYDACSAAVLLCQPSVNESFSIVIMESWLCSRPVLVHADCDVTKDFVLKSQGGLYFSDYKEFAGCMDYFISNPEQANEMGHNGKIFVKETFNWETITKKYIDYFTNLIRVS
ncbi:MAG: glycosyltransferase family 4 protein [Oscillospiraceae bacterium]|nr:glycosyltransferase family 4 protein [Oscillospiraceae bacterium]